LTCRKTCPSRQKTKPQGSRNEAAIRSWVTTVFLAVSRFVTAGCLIIGGGFIITGGARRAAGRIGILRRLAGGVVGWLSAEQAGDLFFQRGDEVFKIKNAAHNRANENLKDKAAGAGSR